MVPGREGELTCTLWLPPFPPVLPQPWDRSTHIQGGSPLLILSRNTLHRHTRRCAL
jgi:hypothetical protein